MRYIFTLLTILMISCGGGGSKQESSNTYSSSPSSNNTSSSSSSSSSSSFSYDKVTSEYDNKDWEALTQGKTTDPQGFINFTKESLSTSITESTNSVSITINGLIDQFSDRAYNVNYSLNLNTNNVSVTELYDVDGSISSYLARGYFSNGYFDLGTYDTDWLETKRIEYVGQALVRINMDSGRKDTFPMVYGSPTDTRDLSSSGTLSHNIISNQVFYMEIDGIGRDVIAFGNGTISNNLTSKDVTGSIVYSDFYDYFQFLSGGTNYSQIQGIPPITFDLTEVKLSGNRLGGYVNIDPSFSSGISGVGRLDGALFGPDGDDLGLVIWAFIDEDHFNNSIVNWNSIGEAIGD